MKTLTQRVLDFAAAREAAGALPPGAGLAVAVIQNGEIVLTHTCGLRERDRNLPVTPRTRFEIGSLTKAFTAAAVLSPRDSGPVDVDRPINASTQLLHLSDAEVTRTISIADILSHRSGMAPHDLLWYFRRLEGRALLSRVAHLELVPGAFRRTFIYSNLMYGALGHLFDGLIGEGYDAFLTRRVLQPLNMRSTSLHITDDEEDVALPYVEMRRVTRVDMSTISAAGGLKSTLQDMTRWVQCQLAAGRDPHGEELIPRDALALMHTRHMPADTVNPILLRGLEWLTETLEYGFGWFLGKTQGMKVVFHPALIDGFSLAVVMIPERRLGFVVMTNVNLSDAPGLLIQELLTALLHRPATDEDSDEQRPLDRDRIVIGTYENPAYGIVRVKQLRDQIVLEYEGNAWPLTWNSEHTAVVEVPAFGVRIPLPVTFDNHNGSVKHLSIPFSLDARVNPHVFTRAPD